jgi:hypothetical protein
MFVLICLPAATAATTASSEAEAVTEAEVTEAEAEHAGLCLMRCK